MKLKIYIHKYTQSFMEGQVHISRHAEPIPDCILVGEHEFEFEMPPEIDLIAREVEQIKLGIEKMEDAFYKQREIMNQRIQSLLCIENNPTSE